MNFSKFLYSNVFKLPFCLLPGRNLHFLVLLCFSAFLNESYLAFLIIVETLSCTFLSISHRLWHYETNPAYNDLPSLEIFHSLATLFFPVSSVPKNQGHLGNCLFYLIGKRNWKLDNNIYSISATLLLLIAEKIINNFITSLFY